MPVCTSTCRAGVGVGVGGWGRGGGVGGQGAGGRELRVAGNSIDRRCSDVTNSDKAYQDRHHAHMSAPAAAQKGGVAGMAVTHLVTVSSAFVVKASAVPLCWNCRIASHHDMFTTPKMLFKSS
jgi:hypothetical protein